MKIIEGYKLVPIDEKSERCNEGANEDCCGNGACWWKDEIRRARESWEQVHSAAPVAPEDKRDAIGTFACPICGYDKPHSHTAIEQNAYREDQMRDDGWISTDKKRPQESGWYLCADVDVKPKHTISAHDSQLHWFLWVRDGASRGASVPEVLYYDRLADRWSLRNLLGNASYSGAESRWIVTASPKYWRDIPSLNINVEAIAAAPNEPTK